MNILGLNAYHGDVSAVLVCDGRLVAAVEEERFVRIKHVAGFPAEAIHACLRIGGLPASAIDCWAVSRDPRAHLWRKAAFLLRQRPHGLAGDRARNLVRVRNLPGRLAGVVGLEPADIRPRLRFVEHHPAHLGSAFFVSPFEEAAVCAIDGFGDFVSTSWGVGRGPSIDGIERVFFPHSLGMLYLAVTQYLGFPHYGDEFKVMGLAPYGAPDFADRLRSVVSLRPGGRFTLDLRFFRHASEGVAMTWESGAPTIGPVFTPALEALLGPARHPDDPLEPRHEAIAASLQRVFEEAVFHVLRHVRQATGQRRLCLAGGCAMNSVANGKVREQTGFDELFLQPAAGDNGTALGAAFDAWHAGGGARGFVMEHGYWGLSFPDDEIEQAIREEAGRLQEMGCTVRRESDPGALCRETASALAAGRIVGWFQGRMEWGARALGNRSILADPRRADMRDILNAKIKFREKFRPFAPSILVEAVDEYFEGAVPDPFMMQVYPIRPAQRSRVPAVTHVDGSGRLQTVSRTSNPLYWQLISAFAAQTGVPMLLNTSFNENEPIVHRPAEALDCFLRTGLDVLVLGSMVLEKAGIGAAAAPGPPA
ncbi:MAG: carbamoyltransferase [Acidobacteriota bacterium]|nr:carbamoyltransferase [Acidobacteriota bacterium]